MQVLDRRQDPLVDDSVVAVSRQGSPRPHIIVGFSIHLPDRAIRQPFVDAFPAFVGNRTWVRRNWVQRGSVIDARQQSYGPGRCSIWHFDLLQRATDDAEWAKVPINGIVYSHQIKEHGSSWKLEYIRDVN